MSCFLWQSLAARKSENELSWSLWKNSHDIKMGKRRLATNVCANPNKLYKKGYILLILAVWTNKSHGTKRHLSLSRTEQGRTGFANNARRHFFFSCVCGVLDIYRFRPRLRH